MARDGIPLINRVINKQTCLHIPDHCSLLQQMSHELKQSPSSIPGHPGLGLLDTDRVPTPTSAGTADLISPATPPKAWAVSATRFPIQSLISPLPLSALTSPFPKNEHPTFAPNVCSLPRDIIYGSIQSLVLSASSYRLQPWLQPVPPPRRC